MLRVFVLMPFAPEFDEVYEHIIKEPLQTEGYEVSRADEINASRSIMHDVISGIVQSDLIIADLTGSNPNVFYELGLAHALGKNVILLSQDIEDVPFDLRAYRVVTYSTHFSRVEQARLLIRKLGIGARDGTAQFGSSISDFARANSLQIPDTNARLATSHRDQPPGMESDYGVLDAVSDIHVSMDSIGRLMSGWTSRLGVLTPKIVDVTALMNGPLRNSPVQMRAKVRELAAAVHEDSRWLRGANSEYRAGIVRLTTGLDAMFASLSSAEPDIDAGIRELLSVLPGIEAKAAGARDKTKALAETLDALPKIEKEFNQAKRGLAEEAHALAENIEQTISVFSRTRAAAAQFQAGSGDDQT